jgi:thioredoxin-like negative regulator of GroEL
MKQRIEMGTNMSEQAKEKQVVREISEKDYEAEVLRATLPAVLDFYAVDSASCKALAPRFGAVAEKFDGKVQFLRILAKDSPTLSAKLGVTASPTVVFFKNGEESGDRLTGDVKRTDLKSRVEALLK